MEKSKNISTSLGFLLLGLGSVIFILIGIVLLCLGGRNLTRGYVSSHWPKTDGIIQSSTISQSYSKAPSNTQQQRTLYGARISYDFQVAGSTYSSSRVSFNDYSHDMNHAQSIHNRYPQGKKVTVYYAPDNPQLAVLETGISDGMWILPIGGTIFLCMGIMIFAIRQAIMQANK